MKTTALILIATVMLLSSCAGAQREQAAGTHASMVTATTAAPPPSPTVARAPTPTPPPPSVDPVLVVVTRPTSRSISSQTQCIDLQEGTMKLELNANNWQSRHTSNVADTWSVSIVQDDGAYAHVLDFQRRNSNADGGSAGAARKLDLAVTNYCSVFLKADVKVLSQTLAGSGWWSDTHGGQGEYPVHLYLDYLDARQQKHVWSWGFLTSQNPAQKTNYDRISLNEWYTFVSQNLMTLDPPPTIITAITIRGDGWDFHGRAANVELRYTTKKE